MRIGPLAASFLAALFIWCATPLAADEMATVVILPPRVLDDDVKSQQQADLFCDRLAQALEKTKGVTVVDRSVIDKILAEHELMGEQRPVLSYDVMVRVTAETVGPGAHLEESAPTR